MAEEPPSSSSTRELLRLAEAPLRRPWLVIIPFLLSVVVAVAVSFVLTPRYRSSSADPGGARADAEQLRAADEHRARRAPAADAAPGGAEPHPARDGRARV